MSEYRYVFGPVLSRRLGRSLGIDLIPFKTCTFDCIYCQLGCTTVHTAERREYAPLDEVFAELERKLAEGPRPDYITLAGSGEPTLHVGLGRFIEGAKQRADIPVAVITNASLVGGVVVRRELLEADLLIPSLDAGTPETFARLNRPHADVAYESIVDGLEALRAEYQGLIWLEVLLVRGINDSEEEVRQIAGHARRIRPDRIQLTTVVRPAMASEVLPVEAAELERLGAILREAAESYGGIAEVVAAYSGGGSEQAGDSSPEDVYALLLRHPCSMDGVAQGLGLHPNVALKHIARLLEAGRITAERLAGEVMYRAMK